MAVIEPAKRWRMTVTSGALEMDNKLEFLIDHLTDDGIPVLERLEHATALKKALEDGVGRLNQIIGELAPVPKEAQTA